MNLKINFEGKVTLPSLILLIGYSLEATLLGILAGYFIDWEVPEFRHLRAVLLVNLLILIGAYFNKDTK